MSSRCDECGYQDNAEFHACHICTMEKDMFRQKSKQTNADRIRGKTDEELAEWIDETYSLAPWCKTWTDPEEPCVCRNADCRKCIGKWLKREAE